MRKPLIAGNWKMHGSRAQAQQLVESIHRGLAKPTAEQIEVLILPPYVYLLEALKFIQHSPLTLGAQDLYLGTQGAYTGCISGQMLVDVGCRYVLIGHSERRTIFKESLSLVAEKFIAAVDAKLIPILCIGETKRERDENKTEAIIAEQVNSVIEVAGIERFQQAVIAYEPVWAIGTGVTASPQNAQDVHAYIRNIIMKNNVDLASTIRILYGGSMKPENAAALLSMPDIDGGLIGGASLNAEHFLAICAAVSNEAAAIKLKKIG